MLEISIYVPTPSAAETRTGFLISYDVKSNNEPNPPIFLKPLIKEPLILVLLDSYDIKLTKLDVLRVFTPLLL